jgi:hypothetical protein
MEAAQVIWHIHPSQGGQGIQQGRPEESQEGTVMPGPLSRVEKMEAWRKSFDTTLLIKKLNGHVLGNETLSQTQIAAAKILLAKTIPDLKQMELTGDAENPVVIQTVRREIVENADN